MGTLGFYIWSVALWNLNVYGHKTHWWATFPYSKNSISFRHSYYLQIRVIFYSFQYGWTFPLLSNHNSLWIFSHAAFCLIFTFKEIDFLAFWIIFYQSIVISFLCSLQHIKKRIMAALESNLIKLRQFSTDVLQHREEKGWIFFQMTLWSP